MLPAAASVPHIATENKNASGDDSAVQKVEDVVSGMLAKGFILGKDALNKAKASDEKHQLTWSKLFKEGYGADVYIITEDKTIIPAHSSVLSNASPVLGNFLQQSN